MKKLLIVFILLANICPSLKKDGLHFFSVNSLQAQSVSYEGEEDDSYTSLGDNGGDNLQGYDHPPAIITPDMAGYEDMHQVSGNMYALELEDGSVAFYLLEHDPNTNEDIYTFNSWNDHPGYDPYNPGSYSDNEEEEDDQGESNNGGLSNDESTQILGDGIDEFYNELNDDDDDGILNALDQDWPFNIYDQEGDHDLDGIYNSYDTDWPYYDPTNPNSQDPYQGRDFSTFLEFMDWLKQNRGRSPLVERSRLLFLVVGPGPEFIYHSDEQGEYNGNPYEVEFVVNEDGEIDLTKSQDGFFEGVHVSVEHGEEHTTFKLSIDYLNNDNRIIEMNTSDMRYTEVFFNMIGMILTNQGKTQIVNHYKQAVIDNANDPDKLDVIYERIPPYALKGFSYKENGQTITVDGIPDDKKMADLRTIAASTLDSYGTDEEKAALNILKGFNDNEYLYNQLHSDPSLVKQLYQGIDGEEAWQFVGILNELGNLFWPVNATLEQDEKSHLYLGQAEESYANPPSYVDPQYAITWQWNNGTTNTDYLLISRFITRTDFNGNATDPSADPVNFPYNRQLDAINPLDPVRFHMGTDDRGYIVPAIYAVRAAEAQNVATIWGSIVTTTNILGVYSALRMILAKGTIFLMRILGVIELGKIAIDAALQNAGVRVRIQNDPELNAFFAPGGTWTIISISTDIATFSLENLFSTAKNARRTAAIMREENQIDAANKMDEIADAAERAIEVNTRWTQDFPTFAPKVDEWKSLDIVYEEAEDQVRILSKNGTEVANIVKEGSTEVLEVADDFFVSDGTGTSLLVTNVNVRTNTGEVLSNVSMVKKADGSIGFLEDLSGFSDQAVKNAIKNRGSLRNTLTGIKSTEEAHHIIPVEVLKDNEVVQKAVQDGFDFNSADNGIPLEKFKKGPPESGRHSRHDHYSDQIKEHLEWWSQQPQNQNYTPTEAKEYIQDLIENIRNQIENSTEKINLLDLGLPHN